MSLKKWLPAFLLLALVMVCPCWADNLDNLGGGPVCQEKQLCGMQLVLRAVAKFHPCPIQRVVASKVLDLWQTSERRILVASATP